LCAFRFQFSDRRRRNGNFWALDNAIVNAVDDQLIIAAAEFSGQVRHAAERNKLTACTFTEPFEFAGERILLPVYNRSATFRPARFGKHRVDFIFFGLKICNQLRAARIVNLSKVIAKRFEITPGA
jgi:hypothetical protein